MFARKQAAERGEPLEINCFGPVIAQEGEERNHAAHDEEWADEVMHRFGDLSEESKDRVAQDRDDDVLTEGQN